MSSFFVRDATAADAAACAAIYAPYVEETAITFETVVPSVDEMAARIRDAQISHAWLVLEERTDGQAENHAESDAESDVVGYAYAGAFAKRSAYQWATEVSVYLDVSKRRSGGGRALYAELLPRLEQRGFRIITACMTLPNDASVGLHKSLGFETVGTFADIGWKLDAWHTTSWMQLRLDGGTTAPAPLQ
jgi:L-amino acid N-acyltransferase YncA